MSGWAWVGVAASVVGAVLRYIVDSLVGARVGPRFPWGTLAVNVTGSFLLGVVTGLALFHGLPEDARLVLGTGLCGGYTTFSTFAFESLRLAEEGRICDSCRNVLGSVVAGGAATALGLALAAIP